jgi:hypothetical protein
MSNLFQSNTSTSSAVIVLKNRFVCSLSDVAMGYNGGCTEIMHIFYKTITGFMLRLNFICLYKVSQRVSK